MDSIRAWALGVCIAAVLGSVIVSLCPSGSMEKSVRTVVSVFILCAIVLPVFKSGFSFSDDISVFSQESRRTEEKLMRQATAQTQDVMKNTVITLLNDNGITCDDVVIEINEDGDTVEISGITVVNADAQPERVKKIIKDSLGIEAKTE